MNRLLIDNNRDQVPNKRGANPDVQGNQVKMEMRTMSARSLSTQLEKSTYVVRFDTTVTPHDRARLGHESRIN